MSCAEYKWYSVQKGPATNNFISGGNSTRYSYQDFPVVLIEGFLSHFMINTRLTFKVHLDFIASCRLSWIKSQNWWNHVSKIMNKTNLRQHTILQVGKIPSMNRQTWPQLTHLSGHCMFTFITPQGASKEGLETTTTLSFINICVAWLWLNQSRPSVWTKMLKKKLWTTGATGKISEQLKKKYIGLWMSHTKCQFCKAPIIYLLLIWISFWTNNLVAHE